MRNRFRAAFTLLEILVVIIIVGVLASVALPSYFRAVERTKAAEAVNNFGMIVRLNEKCHLQGVDICTCMNTTGLAPNWDVLGMNDLNAAGDRHFTYMTSFCNTVTGNYGLVATRNTSDGGDGTSQIVLTYTRLTGTKTIAGGGVFDGMTFN